MTKKHFNKQTILTIVLIAVVTSLVYANSLKNSFVWDDFMLIVNNNFIKSWRNFPYIFNKSYIAPRSDYLDFETLRTFDSSGEISYRPVCTLSFFIDYSLWKLSPFGYHLINLLLHICNAVLLYFFVGLLSKNSKLALLTSLLFALHPVNSEAVANIHFREELLAFLFFLSSFILFVTSSRYAARRRILQYSASLVLFLFSLFSKEMSVTLPLMLILYDYFFIQKNLKNCLSQSLPRYTGYILILLFYLWVQFFVMVNIGNITASYPGGSFYTNTLTMCKVFATYIYWLVVPVNIYATLPNEPNLIANSLFDSGVLLSVFLIIICLVIVVKTYKVSKRICFSMLWFLITLLPVSNIVPITNHIAARYLYIPSAGFCFLTAMLLVNLPGISTSFISKPFLGKLTRIAVVGILVSYGIFTIKRNYIWRDNSAILREMVEYHPNSNIPHKYLGKYFLQTDNLDKAANEFTQAITLAPHDASAHNDLGVCYYKQGKPGKAADEFRQAIKLNPNLANAYDNLGIVSAVKGAYAESIKYFEQSLRIEPRNLKIYYNLGRAYYKMGKLDKARKMWLKALEINPRYKNVQIQLERLQQLNQQAE